MNFELEQTTLHGATPFVRPSKKAHHPTKKQENIMADFVVRIDGVRLSKDAQASINREIQAAVLREIAKLDLRGDFSTRIPGGELQGIYWSGKPFAANFGLQVNEIKTK
jgi:hypothetical protein